jgi:hypothetical protein
MTEQNKSKKRGGNGNGNYTAEGIKVAENMEDVRPCPDRCTLARTLEGIAISLSMKLWTTPSMAGPI